MRYNARFLSMRIYLAYNF